MKKVININLGGQAFTVDHDAYEVLEIYLDSIEKRFAGSTGVEDIMYDIEARLAELFNEQAEHSDIITMNKVNKVKKIMGTPNDFGEADATYNDNPQTSHSSKRLFRDPNDKVIAGVASGLTAYYGLKTPLVFRALFILLFFGGFGFLIYIGLWLFVPSAKTASDRLAMHGEEINIETIANSVEESLIDIKDTLEDLGNKFKNKVL